MRYEGALALKKRKNITEEIVHIMQTNEEEEYNAKSIVIELSKRKIQTSVASVRKILSRLHDQGILERAQKGFYRAKSTSEDDFKLISKEGLSDLVAPGHNKKFLIHNLTLIAQKENITEIEKKKRDKLTLRVNGVNINASDLFNPFSTLSFFQRYKPYDSKRLSNSYMKEYIFKHNEKRKITLRVYDNSTIHIFITVDEDPLRLEELHEVILYIDMLFQSQFSYSFFDLMPIFFPERFELNIDDRKVSSDAIPKSLTMTVQMLEEWAYRQYQKTIEGEDYLRKEYVYHHRKGEPLPPDVDAFMASLTSALMGGVNTQYLIYNTKQLFDTVNVMREELSEIKKATQYNLAENRKLMREILKVKGGKE